MSVGWRVEITADAEAALRDLPHAAATGVGRALDDVATRGVDLSTGEMASGEWVGTIDVGDHRLVMAARIAERVAILVRLDTIDASGAVDLVPIRTRTRRGIGRWLEGVGVDLRYTARALRRSPLFAAIVIGTLALGIGGATALLHVVRTVYLGALPFPDGDRLVRIRNLNVGPDGETRRFNVAAGDFHLLAREGKGYSSVVASVGRSLTLVGDGPAERISAIGVSTGWLATLGIRPVIGRAFTGAEEMAGRDAPVALISHALWQRRFGGDSTALGRSLVQDGGTLEVIGILAPGIHYPYEADVWTPWTFDPTEIRASELNITARLAPGATIASARTDGERAHAIRVAQGTATTATAFDVASFRDDSIREGGRMINALAAAVLFLLVLTCVNVANLLVGRFATRRGEIAVRAALGAGRGRQLRQLLIEALALFAVGGVGGILFALWLGRILGVLVPETLRTELGMTGSRVAPDTILVALAVTALAGVVVGAVAAVRTAGPNVAASVKDGGRQGGGRRDRRFLDGLVVAQLCLSLVLLVGAAVLIDHFRRLVDRDPGYRLAGVTTLRINLDQPRYRDTTQRLTLVRAIEAGTAAIPGVDRVGITTVNPLCCGDWGAPIEFEGRPVDPGSPPTLIAHSYVTPTWFETLGIRRLVGTGFDAEDRPGGEHTVIIDEEFARMGWPGQDPIGKRVRLARPNQPWRTVIGVVPVIVHRAEMRAAWYLPYWQDPLGASATLLHLMVRSERSVDTEAIRRMIATLDPALAVYGVRSMESLAAEWRAPDRLGAVVSAIFASFGLVLAGFSLYGLLSYSVEVRRAEIGTRLALGATRRGVLSLILRQAGAKVALGIGIGVFLALGFNQLLRGMIAGVTWIPWSGLAAVVAVLTTIALIAAAIPALRAAAVDPTQSLRA